jgi:hypothetical protein
VGNADKKVCSSLLIVVQSGLDGLITRTRSLTLLKRSRAGRNASVMRVLVSVIADFNSIQARLVGLHGGCTSDPGQDPADWDPQVGAARASSYPDPVSRCFQDILNVSEDNLDIFGS